MRLTHLVYIIAACSLSLHAGIHNYNLITRIHNDTKAPSFTLPLCAATATGSIKATREIMQLPQACKRSACLRQFGRLGIGVPVYTLTSFAIASTLYYPTGSYLYKTYPFFPAKP